MGEGTDDSRKKPELLECTAKAMSEERGFQVEEKARAKALR